MMTGTKSDIEKFDGKNDFALWQVRMKALLEQQGLAAGGSQSEYIDEFHKLVGDLAAIDTAISDEDQAFLLLTSLPSSYDNLVETLLYGRDTIKLEDVVATLNSRELQKMTEAKGDGGEGFYVRRRSGQRDMEYNHKKSQGFVRNEDQVSSSGADGFDNVDVMMAMSDEELLDWIMDSGSSYYITYKRDYLVDFKEYDSGNILLSDSRECRVRGTGKVQVQMRDGSSFVLDNVRSTQQYIKSGVAKHLGVAGIQQQNRLVNETNMTLFAKVKCIFLGYRKGIVGNKLWRLDDVTSKVVVYRNMGCNESGEYKKTFIGSGVGMGLMQVLQGVKFVVEPQEDHTFEVEPHGNVNHVAGSEEAGLKDDTDARSDVYVLSNGCKKCSDDIDVYYWEYTPGFAG
ncbi:hypothetical protein Tco_0984750 [Tanacetum coccineum]